MAGPGPHLIGEPVDLITMDLSYLAIADAIGQVDRQMLAPAAQLIALVKPTFELHAAEAQQYSGGAKASPRRNHGWQDTRPAAVREKGADEISQAASGCR